MEKSLLIRYLSLFSGIGCDALAMKSLKDANPNVQFKCVGFSEIDPIAVELYQHHYAGHRNLGSVISITKKVLKTLKPIDLIIGGSPCQGFTQAGKREGLQDDRSMLFWEFVRIIKIACPRWFVLENVGSMKLKDRAIITDALGTDYLRIQSSALTAQNRNRFYWTNFTVTIPEDNHIYLSSIVACDENDDSDPKDVIIHSCNLLQISKDAVSNAIVEPPFAFGLRRKKGLNCNAHAKYCDFKHIPRIDRKSNPCICTVDWTSLIFDGRRVRRLSVEEFEQLQGLPEDYTVLNETTPTETHRRKLIGNGFTVPIMKHILQCLLDDRTPTFSCPSASPIS